MELKEFGKKEMINLLTDFLVSRLSGYDIGEIIKDLVDLAYKNFTEGEVKELEKITKKFKVDFKKDKVPAVLAYILSRK